MVSAQYLLNLTTIYPQADTGISPPSLRKIEASVGQIRLYGDNAESNSAPMPAAVKKIARYTRDYPDRALSLLGIGLTVNLLTNVLRFYKM